MNTKFNLCVEQLRALGEPTRLRMISVLRQSDLSVGELVEILCQSQPSISQHLKTLTQCGLVERLPEGAFVFYRAATNDQGVVALLNAIFSHCKIEQTELARDQSRLEFVRSARAKSVDSYFQQLTDDWNQTGELNYFDSELESVLLEAAGPNPLSNVIDIGTGIGQMLTLFSKRATSIEGVDCNHEMLMVARVNLTRDQINNAKVRQGDATALPFSDDCADLVIVHQVLHYLDKPEKVIAEASRVLRPNGRLLIIDFSPHNLHFLRDHHSHRHLGLAQSLLAEWSRQFNLYPILHRELATKIDSEKKPTIQVFAAEKLESKVEGIAA